jgi:hypothetical protein
MVQPVTFLPLVTRADAMGPLVYAGIIQMHNLGNLATSQLTVITIMVFAFTRSRLVLMALAMLTIRSLMVTIVSAAAIHTFAKLEVSVT